MYFIVCSYLCNWEDGAIAQILKLPSDYTYRTYIRKTTTNGKADPNTFAYRDAETKINSCTGFRWESM